MKMVKVVPSRVWQHKVTGKTVSLYGALPVPVEAYEVVQRGWTHLMSNGTVGYGQPPSQSEEEAEQVMALYNAMDWDGLRAYKASLKVGA